jgi:hypothetical protein
LNARPIRIIRHAESYEVRFADSRPSVYFYDDDHAGRRAITGRMSGAEAEEQARILARHARLDLLKPYLILVARC